MYFFFATYFLEHKRKKSIYSKNIFWHVFAKNIEKCLLWEPPSPWWWQWAICGQCHRDTTLTTMATMTRWWCGHSMMMTMTCPCHNVNNDMPMANGMVIWQWWHVHVTMAWQQWQGSHSTIRMMTMMASHTWPVPQQHDTNNDDKEVEVATGWWQWWWCSHASAMQTMTQGI